MSTLDTSVDAPQRLSTATLFVVGAALTIVGSVGFIAMNGQEPREAYIHPVGVIGSALAAIGCLALTIGLVQWRSSVPRWAVLSSAAGVWVAGATAWGQATVVVAAGINTSNETFDALFFESPWVLGGMAPKSVLCLVGFLGIAIAGWRQRSVPRLAAAAFALAAVVSLWPPFPPGMIIASLALMVVARALRASR